MEALSLYVTVCQFTPREIILGELILADEEKKIKFGGGYFGGFLVKCVFGGIYFSGWPSEMV